MSSPSLVIDKSSQCISHFLYSISILSRKPQTSRYDFEIEMASFLGIDIQNTKTGSNNRGPYNKSKLPQYFGFIKSEKISKIEFLSLTSRGELLNQIISDKGIDTEHKKRYYISNENIVNFQQLLMDSILFDSFGKNNSAVPTSNSAVQPPIIIFKTISVLNSATAEEIYYVIYGINNGLFESFDDAINQVINNRIDKEYSYHSILEEFGQIINTNDCKIIKIFTDSSIKMLSKYTEAGKEYYKIHPNMNNKFLNQINKMGEIFLPKNILFYCRDNHLVSEWLEKSALGNINPNNLFYTNKIDYLEKGEGEHSDFTSKTIEKSLEYSLFNPEEKVYLIIKNTCESEIFSTLGEYAILINREEKFNSPYCGWSTNSIINEHFYSYILKNKQDIHLFLDKNEVKFPPNFNIVGIVDMGKNSSVDYDYNIDRCLISSLNEKDDDNYFVKINEDEREKNGNNVLLYGVPGSGKSWTISNEYCDNDDYVERIVFHPEYSYADFVGQILPILDDDKKLKYDFIPGPFTQILKSAMINPKHKYYLIIEEINRGNAPAIFGDIFQLLDRKKEGVCIGESQYSITNSNISKTVFGNPDNKIFLPSNLSIIGTMNTSDQNIFTLDTAFQRRWDMRLIENNFSNVSEDFSNKMILDSKVTWKQFCLCINEAILSNNSMVVSSEDKRLGVYFVSKEQLNFDEKENNDMISKEDRQIAKMKNRRFGDKIIKYLWDDVFKYSRDDIFNMGKFTDLESILRHFNCHKGNKRFMIFSETVVNDLIKTDFEIDGFGG